MLYQPLFMQPSNVDISASEANTFSFQVNGSVCKAYKITILNNSTNDVVYDQFITDISSSPKYNGETIEATIPATSIVRTNTTNGAGTTTTILLDASASAVDDFYNGNYINYENQIRLITDYVGATKTATISPALTASSVTAKPYTITSNTGMTNGVNSNFKWYVRLYENYPAATPTYVQSYETYFQCRSASSLSISNYIATIDNKTYTFTGSYSQAENISVKWYQWFLYDSNNNVVNNTNKIYSANITYTYDGFLSGQNDMGIELIIENQNGTQVDTGILRFDVLYDEPVVNLKPELIVLEDKDAIEVSWDNAIILPGKQSDSNIGYQYLNDIMYSGDKSVQVLTGNTIYYDEANSGDLTIPDNFTGYLYVNLPTGFSGYIIKLENTNNGDFYTVEYVTDRFSYSINGTITGEYIDANARGNNYWWKITLLPNGAQFKKISFNILTPTTTLYPSNTLYPIFTVI